ncbi:MAG: bifunctional glycosyltransferase family 2/GtrA family protein [Acidobacteriaceae bacterium]|nr:bifunctional glycosyltransferase family 2/GtrA family protein [Acidobacteriaceae bacterium]
MNAHSDLSRIAVLIPAREPELRLVALVQAVAAAGFGAVIVLDDGSSPECAAIFDAAAQSAGVHRLRHAVNLGKGRALKTGINYFLNELTGFTGLVTADADGQHTPVDIVRVASALLTANGRVVLGVRHFSQDVPLRSKFGNLLTRQIFRFATGAKLGDTQTGLRAFPRETLTELLTLEGERYEYEMTVLAHICRSGRRPLEVPIKTVYIDGNKSSHFDPIRDSMRIYFVLLRFFASSIVASGIDFVGFAVTFALTRNVLISLIVGRLSSLANFALNKRYVFHSGVPLPRTLLRYYLLVLAVAAVSYGAIRGLTEYLGWNVFVTKLVVDTLLSLVSFSIQRTLVFPIREEE